MIKISCSKLEEVKQNPQAYAQKLKNSENTGGGAYGMFQCWQSCVRLVLQGRNNVEQAIEALQRQFVRFADTTANKKKQEFFMDRLRPFIEEFELKQYTYLSDQKHINWELVPGVELTGKTPVSVSDNKQYAAFIYTENPIGWHSQLRFPLIQTYLAKNIFKCSPKDVNIGTFCLETLRFDLRSFSNVEIDDAVSEMMKISETVSSVFNGK